MCTGLARSALLLAAVLCLAPACRAGADPAWNTVDDMPVVDLVEPADDATVARWISDLGEMRGDASRRARKKLLEQGLRVADPLRDVAGEDSLRGLNARSVLEILAPSIRTAWTLQDLADFTIIDDGRGILAWTGDPPRNLIQFDTGTGKPARTVTEKDLQGLFDEKDDIFWNPRLRPRLDPKSGHYVVMTWSKTQVTLNPGDGKLSKSEFLPEPTLRRRWASERKTVPRSLTLPDQSVIQWSNDGVQARRAKSDAWTYLTLGRIRARVHDVGATPFHFYTLLDFGLCAHNRMSLKLELEAWAPPGAEWMHVSAQTGLVILGGEDWTSLAVLGGLPPKPLGRCPAQFGAMRAMASDRDGRWIATADEAGFIRIFLAETLERITTVAGTAPVDRLEFSSDPPLLMAITGKEDGWNRRHSIQAWTLSPPPATK